MITLTGKVFAISVPVIVGFSQGIFAWKSMNSQWYKKLNKAPFHPPAFIVFLTFILMNGVMGYASIRICEEYLQSKVSSKATERHDQQIKLTLIAYLVQFTMTSLWPILFFIVRKPTLALVQIMIADAAVIFCMKLFYDVDETLRYLTLPHLLWTLWWTILLYSVWLLNRTSSLTLHEDILNQDIARRPNRHQYRPLTTKSHTVKTYGVYI